MLLLQVALDAVMLVIAFYLGYLVRIYVPILTPPDDPPGFLERYIPLTTLHVLAVITIFYLARLYHQKRATSQVDQLWLIVQNVAIGTLLAVAADSLIFANTSLQFDYPRSVIVYAWGFGVILIVAGRAAHRVIVQRLHKMGIGRDNVIVVGHNEVAKSVVRSIRQNQTLGYHLVGVVTPTGEGRVAKTDVIGYTYDLPYLIDTYAVDQVIIAIPEATRQELIGLVALCQRGQVDIKIYPDNFAFMAGTLTVDDLVGIPLLSVRDVALRGWKLSLKRLVDFLGAAAGLVALSPMMMTTAILIWLYDRGPVFFSQERVGLDGRPFPMIKFRTMVTDAETRRRWTTANDDRVTPVGRFLRPRNLDELPQLINVLYGQMSLVGPRPEQISFVQEFLQKYPRYGERHREKSGMTGWAQVNGYRGDTSIEERLRADLYYVENWSLWLDLKIIFRTVWQTVSGRSPNAY